VPVALPPLSTPLPELPEPLSMEFFPEMSLPAQTGESPQFVLAQESGHESNETLPLRREGGWLRRAAILVAAGLALATAGLGLNEWELRRQELAQPVSLPALPTAPAKHVSAGAAPVIPPPEFFAPVIP
jgi:hypothetical protein